MGDVIKLFTYDEMESEFHKHFQQYKVCKQKAFYFGEGAELYLKISGAKTDLFVEQEDLYHGFLQDNIDITKDEFVIISLGCADARKEKVMLERLSRDSDKVSFIGVDSSEEMICIAKETLKESPVSCEFICADFSSDEFIKRIHAVTQGKIRIFTFLGSTFGNVEQSYMADMLYDLLEKGDKLWLEVAVRESISDKADRKFFENYLSWFDNEVTRDFLLHPLKLLGVPLDSGELFLNMAAEGDLNALLFSFRFRIDTKTVIEFDEHTVTLLPGNVIELLTIRAYDPQGLRNFFEERNFKFLAYKKCAGKTERGEFMFEKL
ncbi:L-histidine N(alpha)-methyltransferase [Candidatus Nomurabacteria bacterium]|nr:L-histidine N(alpha)-methyltransferase [Candidatus Nomurabacteria bacterium]